LAKRGDLPARSRFGEGRGEILIHNDDTVLDGRREGEDVVRRLIQESDRVT
jgi:hypothetical protein